jgi:hypothetical protein
MINPKKYIEVGSGNSTKLAKKAIIEANVLLLLDHNDFKRSGDLSDSVVASKAQKITSSTLSG